MGKGAVPERGLLPAGFFSYLKPGDRDAIREAGENPAQGVAERLQPVRAGEAAASNGRRRVGQKPPRGLRRKCLGSQIAQPVKAPETGSFTKERAVVGATR